MSMKKLQKYLVAVAWGLVGLTLIEHDPSFTLHSDMNALIEVIFDLFGIMAIVKMWDRLNQDL